MTQTQQDSSITDDDESFSESEHGNDQDNQPPSSTGVSPDTITVFTINTACNLRLTANGEKLLFQFSQVFFLSFCCRLMTLTQCFELNVKLALIYQQVTLIKLKETYSHHGPSMTTQESDVMCGS